MSKNNLKIIFAITEEGYFNGSNNEGLPWSHLKNDMNNFKKITTGNGNNAVVMGSKTFLSIIKGRNIYYLPNRINIVISSTLSPDSYPAINIVSSTDEAIKKARSFNVDEIFFIGGKQLIYDVLTKYNPSEIHLSMITHTDKQYNVDKTSKIDFTNDLEEIISEFYYSSCSTITLEKDYVINYDRYTLKDNIHTDEIKYINLIKHVLETGKEREDRTEVGTISSFGNHFELDVSKYFPLLTTKRVFWKGVVEELLFFLSGSSDTTLLEKKGVNIWKGNTSRQFLDKRGLHSYKEGELGPGYGHQWRNFGGSYTPILNRENDEQNTGVDQIQQAIDMIQNDPYSRRIIVNAWNPQMLEQMSLVPCHYCFQFYVEPDTRQLSMLVNMRSCDVFLGLPFNIASYSLLLYMVAKITDLKPSKISFTLGDTHIYKNHVDQCKEQILRSLRPLPKLTIREKKNINDYTIYDFILERYNPHPNIKADMAI